MKFVKSTSVEDLQVIGRFEYLRKVLLAEQYAVHLDKPLVYWALPADRRLPLALLGRKLGDLLATPFAELAATPGIGYKKIHSFIKLLARAANTDPAELPPDLPADQSGRLPADQWGRLPADQSGRLPADQSGRLPADQWGRHSCLPMDQEDRGPSLPQDRWGENSPLPAEQALSPDAFDPTTVSEIVWEQWRATVLRHGLGPEPLGRFAPSLMHMTHVIWRRPLADYAGMSLGEICRLKTHGEKRIRAILEAFHALHSLLAQVDPQEHLVLRIVPRQIDAVETWASRQLQVPGAPPEDELRTRLVEPLLAQLRIDATEQIVALAENRLGVHAPLTSVRQVARTLGLTRARVYQLLNEINDIMTIRWPTGRQQVYQLDAKFRADAQRLEQPVQLDQFQAAIELFYPRSRRGASGMLDRMDGPHTLAAAAGPARNGHDAHLDGTETAAATQQ